ncbi:hypothetical protein PR048_021163 [Dryococelus australis]|uniref:DDE Tnp4 domain-containing protein n=1 Tax=Dryococelus australis TaxID=614101 RepID=A0ABQ9GXH3_9NEOP|nr:hypothetical protein PR048_021163 [Dryococelus australis]
MAFLDDGELLRIGFEQNESSEDEGDVVINKIIADTTIINNEERVFPGYMILNDVFELLDREGRTCIEIYVENIVPQYSEGTFISHFRMKRTMVQDVVNKFQATEAFASIQGTIYIFNKSNGGYQPISPEKHILAFLWFVGHQTDSYRDAADRFDITTSSLHEVLIVSTSGDKDNMILGNIVSCSVDGCHVRLDKPAGDKDAYVNIKHYFSVHLQGTVNEKRKFMDVFIVYPGSVHDARVFANSPLADDLPTLCEGGGHVLGDSAYPCLPQLITPYKDNGHLTRTQRSLNSIHNSCRIIVEHAFGCLKQHFRQLYHLKLREMQRVVQLIHACCVLHNLSDEVDLSHLEPLERDDHPDRNAVQLLDYRHKAGDLMPMEEDGDHNDSSRERHQK